MPNQPNQNSATSKSAGEELATKVKESLPQSSFDNLTMVLAISGGPDSVALAHFLATRIDRHSSRIYLAHFNHRLRGDESDSDEQFVQELAGQLNCELLLGRADSLNSGDAHLAEESPPSNRGEGLESLARDARYAFLKHAAFEVGARLVATAHTFEDQVETIVHRFFRGSGIRGLVGIQPVREWTAGVSLVRPFLNCQKELLLRYLKENGQDYRTDHSNFSQQFTRNRIRRELLPLAADIFENDLWQAVSTIGTHFQEILDLLDPQIDSRLASHVKFLSDEVVVRLDAELTALPPVLLNELWVRIWTQMNWPRKDMSRRKWNAISELATQDKQAKINLPGNLLVEKKDSGELIIWAG